MSPRSHLLPRLYASAQSWARALFHQGRAAQDAEEELRFHIEAYAADLAAQGVPPVEAHRRAAAALGQPANQGERHREAIALRLLDEVRGDIRYGLRGLLRNPGFAAIAILSLGLAIGTATAMFSVVYATILDVFPYANADRIVDLMVEAPPGQVEWDAPAYLSEAQYKLFRRAAPFEDALGIGIMSVSLDQETGRQTLQVALLTPDAAGFLQVPARYGRGLVTSDGGIGDPVPNVLVLSYKYWRSQYGSDPAAVGRKVRLGKTNYTIVGVMPSRFTIGSSPDVYMPFSQFSTPHSRMTVLAKLKPGVTSAQATAAILPTMRSFARQDPAAYPDHFHIRMQTLRESYTSSSRFVRSLPMLLLSVGILLLIGCVNCSVLLLARSTVRQHEFALRAAVGATRMRMVRQLLVESLTLSLLGSLLGIALSYFLARLPLQLAPSLFPSETVIRTSLPVLAVVVGIAMLSGLLFGFFPALRAARPHIAQVLQAGNRRSTSGTAHKPLRILIGIQIALTLVLLTVAGATATGFLNIVRLRLGFNPNNIAIVNVAFGLPSPWTKRIATLDAVRAALRATPGVVSVAVSGGAIPPDGGFTQTMQMVGKSVPNGVQIRELDVSPDYFQTLQIPLLAGRIWTASDAHLGLPLAVVNKSFAQRFSPGRSILGQVVRLPQVHIHKPSEFDAFSPAFTVPQFEITGVVADALNDGLNKPVQPELYINQGAMPSPGGWFFVRTRVDPQQSMRALRHALAPFYNGNYVVVLPDSLQRNIESQPEWQQQRLVAALFGIYAAIALTLALVGLYSVVEYISLQRRGEFGIRLALGADRGNILWLVLRGNLLLIAYAATAGLLLSLLARRGIERWLTGSSQNPSILFAAAALLAAVSTAACVFPAYRASRVNPNEALRAE
jgi:predicted permease